MTPPLLRSLIEAASQTDLQPLAVSGDIYITQPLFDLELEKIFKHEWCCVGRTDEVPNPGDYFTTTVGVVPIIIIRRDAGEIGAMLNVCAHRLSQVASGKGHAARFACPYHGWVYDRSGKLIHATHMSDTVDPPTCSLHSVRVECWKGFIYVNVDPDAAPLAPSLEPLDSLIAPYHLERMQTLHKGQEVWQANWKICTENFLESYHIGMVHAKTLAPLVPHETLRMVPDGPGYAFHTLRWSDAAMMDLDPAIAIENHDLTEEQRRTVYVGGVFPNHLFTVAYDQITWIRAQPLAVDQTLVEWGVAGSFNIPHGTKPDPEHPNLYYLKAIPAVNLEDKVVVEGVQRGARAGLVRPSRLHPYEQPLLQFARYLASRLGAQPR
jgi:phenylpropionate dioxygenase-like ring-hydroxylating dioxygenase large terminal subunit